MATDRNRELPMMKLLQPAITYLQELARDAIAGWNRFWFTPADPINLAVIRIITGFILLHTHLATLPDLLDFIGPRAWIDSQALAELQSTSVGMGNSGPDAWPGGEQSIWFYIQDPRWIWALHVLFLIAAVCFTLGIFSRMASVIVWAGHLSYIQRGIVIIYGMDSVLAMLTLYLMFAPIGTELSLDRWWRRRRTPDAAAGNDEAKKSVAANVVLRALQLHLCLIYLFSGLSKLAGGAWWNGTAVYTALMIPEATLFDMAWMARRDWLWLVLSNAGSFATLALELGFPIFVWHRRLRPLMLASAIAMQVGLGLLLSLGAFQAAMFAALCAFFPPQALRRWSAEP